MIWKYFIWLSLFRIIISFPPLLFSSSPLPGTWSFRRAIASKLPWTPNDQNVHNTLIPWISWILLAWRNEKRTWYWSWWDMIQSQLFLTNAPFEKDCNGPILVLHLSCVTSLDVLLLTGMEEVCVRWADYYKTIAKSYLISILKMVWCWLDKGSNTLAISVPTYDALLENLHWHAASASSVIGEWEQLCSRWVFQIFALRSSIKFWGKWFNNTVSMNHRWTVFIFCSVRNKGFSRLVNSYWVRMLWSWGFWKFLLGL